MALKRTKGGPSPTASAPAAPPCVMVIFGARGDLTKRLLIPALYNLAVAGLLADGFRIIGVDHGACDDHALRKSLGGFLESLAADPQSEFGAGKIDAKAWTWLADRISYLKGDFEAASTYAAIAERLNSGGADVCALFYLATAPRFFGDIVDHLAAAGLTGAGQGGFRRVVIEKPFGDDLATAKALNRPAS